MGTCGTLEPRVRSSAWGRDGEGAPHTGISRALVKRREGTAVLGWRDGLSSRSHGGKRLRYLPEVHRLVPNPWFYCPGENNPSHRNSSSTEIPHRGKQFPHQTSFIGYKYLIICTRPWNARHFAAFITCVGVFTNDTYITIHLYIVVCVVKCVVICIYIYVCGYTLTNLI